MKLSQNQIWKRFWILALLASLPLVGSVFAQEEEEEDEIETLSVFEVSEAEDFGYRVSNSQTATRIGAEIYEIPLNVQVISEEFLQDTNIGTQIHEVLRYTAAASGDSQMGVLQPGTNFTPSGVMTVRGFPVSLRLQDNIFRYTGYNSDIVDRIEIVKGPAATFYGKGYPGGVINYVTKSARLADLPTTFSYRIGSFDSHKLKFDNNVLLRDNLAFRTLLVLENSEGDQQFEYLHRNTVFTSVRWAPTDNLLITGRFEFMEDSQNTSRYGWIWPEEYFASWANPTQAQLDAAVSAGRISTPDVQEFQDYFLPNNRFGQWLGVFRAAENNPNYAPYTSLQGGATYQAMTEAAAGDPLEWNSFGPDDYADRTVENYNIKAVWSPLDWLDLNFEFNREKAVYDEMRSQMRPNADGRTFHTLRGDTWRDYEQNTDNFIFDGVINFTAGPLESNVLFGHIVRTYRSEFGGTPIGFSRWDYRQVPGYPSDGTGQSQGPTWNVFELQTLQDRDGNDMTPQQVYTQYDPEIHPRPTLSTIAQTRRTLRDRYVPKEEETYFSYQGTLWDRFHITGGFRTEERDPRGGQVVDTNPPWYNGIPFMLDNIPEDQWPAYAMSESYQSSVLGNTKAGDSFMFGAMYEITPEISVYASVSESYRPNRGRLANWNDNNVREAVNTFIAENPGQTTFTSGQAEVDRLYATAPEAKNETGENIELGFKTILWEGKLDMTVSAFQLDRANRYVDDSDRTQDDELNNIVLNSGAVGRLVRWFTNDAFERAEGIEAEVIWTPTPNYQMKVSASNLWTAEVVEDPSLSPDAVQFERRLPNAPEIRLNFWNKYTFIDGALEGLSLGGGFRYSSAFEQSNTSRNWAAEFHDAYLVFDALAAYQTQIYETPVTFRVNINNVLDEVYSEGGWNFAPRRAYYLTTEFKF